MKFYRILDPSKKRRQNKKQKLFESENNEKESKIQKK